MKSQIGYVVLALVCGCAMATRSLQQAGIPACPAPLVMNGTINCPHDMVYYYCEGGPGVGGCRPTEFGPSDCSNECVFDSSNPIYDPPICPDDIVTGCYLDQQYYQCFDNWQCQPKSKGWVAGCTKQCLTTGKPNPRQWGNRTFTVVNQCPHEVWVGAYAENVEPTWGNISTKNSKPTIVLPTLSGGSSSFNLQPGARLSLDVRGRTAGRVWGRTGCTPGPNGALTCKIGDCGGQEVCEQSNARGATLFEWTLDTIVDGWDVSAVDGYTLPIDVTPLNGFIRKDSTCGTAKCNLTDNILCNPEVVYTATGPGVQPACLQPCTAFGIPDMLASSPYLQQLYTNNTAEGKPMKDLLCCSCGCGDNCFCENPSCNYGCSPYSQPPNKWGVCRIQDWPLGTAGYAYNSAIKAACSNSYSWPFDDFAATLYCAAADYQITFCPSS